ncbi:MAG TPA: cyclic pyranopterin monophosphate synthase MoaC [Planctomycetaceae bacterium]|nr:cyclic pyranopterin monophosphate synthase MoaC [Planctomycetaceae bacterium]
MDPNKAQSNHFDPGGNARMVDVTAKPITTRTATAKGDVVMRPETAEMIRGGTAKKGDVLTIARIAAISATKLTPLLIPLCHGIAVEAVDVRFCFEPQKSSAPHLAVRDGDSVTLCCEVDVRSSGKTGVEMEALTAVMAGCLTVFDMCKSIDRGMTIQGVRVVAKSGGASGDFFAP